MDFPVYYLLQWFNNVYITGLFTYSHIGILVWGTIMFNQTQECDDNLYMVTLIVIIIHAFMPLGIGLLWGTLIIINYIFEFPRLDSILSTMSRMSFSSSTTASREQLQRLRTFIFTGPILHDCVICYTSMSPGQEIRVLPCHHQFHATCIDPWLLEHHRTCPVCRNDITHNPGNVPDNLV